MEAKSAAGHPATAVLCLLFHAVPKLCPSTTPQGAAGTQPLCLCRPPDPCCSAKGDLSDEDDDNEFFDAPEIITVPESMGHK